MADTKPDPKKVLEFVKEHNVKILDLRFTDLPGLWHHVSYPIANSAKRPSRKASALTAQSIRGWAAIHESDMLLIPDPATRLHRPLHAKCPRW